MVRRPPFQEHRTAHQRTARAREPRSLAVAVALPAAPLAVAYLLAHPALAVAAVVALTVMFAARGRPA